MEDQCQSDACCVSGKLKNKNIFKDKGLSFYVSSKYRIIFDKLETQSLPQISKSYTRRRRRLTEKCWTQSIILRIKLLSLLVNAKILLF